MIIEILIIIVVCGVLLISQNESPPENKVKYPKIYLCIGIISLLFWTFFLFLIIINDIPIYNSIFSIFTIGGFIVLSLIIITSYFNIYTTFDTKSFTHSNFLRKKKTMQYADIKTIYRKRHAKYLVVFESSNEKIIIDSKYTIGYKAFIETVNSKRFNKQ
jgi:hypothetical protein